MREPVIFYKDANFTTEWQGYYEVEYVGNKARVHSQVFGREVKSRLCKLTKIGGKIEPNKPKVSYYALIVNGQKTFFKSTYQIPTINLK